MLNHPLKTLDLRFCKASSDLGHDFSLIQGAGGNTSVKIDNSLWVKASGEWLKDAFNQSIFVEIDIALAKQAVLEGADNLSEFKKNLDQKHLKPSIETALHLLIPKKYVFHFHSINAISWLVQKSSKDKVEPLLRGALWAFIPYAKPGIHLAQYLLNNKVNLNADIFLLQNHGVIVASNEIDQLIFLINDLEKRLFLKLEDLTYLKGSFLEDLAIENNLQIPSEDEINYIAFSNKALNILRNGILYPDHAVFLGDNPLIIDQGDFKTLNFVIKNNLNHSFFVLKNQGILFSKNISKNSKALLQCFSRVVRKISNIDEINFLSKEDVNEIFSFEPEKFRKMTSK